MPDNVFKLECDKAYDEGKPLISDEAYDNLFGESPEVGRPGYSSDIKHAWPLYSLNKYYVEDGTPPLRSDDCVVTPKLDGAAVALLYVDGVLQQGLSRGNGIKGKDVTSKLVHLVPGVISPTAPLVQIKGELVARADVVNSRNMAAGSLGLKSEDEFLTRVDEIGLEFIAYGVTTAEEGFDTYTESMDYLYEEGFRTVLEDTSVFPTDGLVYRLDDNAKFASLGFTSKHPRGAYAFKEKQKPVITTLLDVVWQTGKSGKVTPVAILESVKIGDANVTRATLNNMTYIKSLGLEIGCRVEVIRSGEIIPQVLARAD